MNATHESPEMVALTIIEPPGRNRSLGLAEIWKFRSVGRALTRRNLMVRYRQTALGVSWVLVQPLALMIVFSVFFSVIERFSNLGVPFPVFYICALWLWMPLTKVLTEGVTSIITNEQLVTRVYVPRALIPISVAAATFVDLLFIFIAFEIVLLFYGFLPTPAVMITPVLVVIGYMTTLGVTFLSAALNTRYRDAQLALPFLLQVWFFVSPIIYPAEWIPEQLLPLYYLNPMALVITGSRWAFAGMAAPPDYAWVLATIVSVVCLVGGYAYFRRREPLFADDL